MKFLTEDKKLDARVAWLQKKISTLDDYGNEKGYELKIKDKGIEDTIENHIAKYKDELASIYDNPEFLTEDLEIYDAVAYISGNEDYEAITGKVKFTTYDNEVKVNVNLQNLPQSTYLGFHIHDVGECKDDFTSAEGHYNPEDAEHPEHRGDLPLLYTSNGYIDTVFLTNNFTVNEIIGKSIIVHEEADDYKSQPAGDSGNRIACGVIRDIKDDNLMIKEDLNTIPEPFKKYYTIDTSEDIIDATSAADILEYDMTHIAWLKAKPAFKAALSDNGLEIAELVKDNDLNDSFVVQLVGGRVYPIDLEELQNITTVTEDFNLQNQVTESKHKELKDGQEGYAIGTEDKFWPPYYDLEDEAIAAGVQYLKSSKNVNKDDVFMVHSVYNEFGDEDSDLIGVYDAAGQPITDYEEYLQDKRAYVYYDELEKVLAEKCDCDLEDVYLEPSTQGGMGIVTIFIKDKDCGDVDFETSEDYIADDDLAGFIKLFLDNLDCDRMDESKNPLKDAQKFARKRQKRLPALSTLNPNAGDVEKGVEMFNAATDTGSASLGEDLHNATLDDIVNKIFVNGPEVRGEAYPPFETFAINEENIPDNMRYKQWDAYISETDDNVIQFDYTTQEPFTPEAADKFIVEAKRAFNDLADHEGYGKPFTVALNIEARSGRDDGALVYDLTINSDTINESKNDNNNQNSEVDNNSFSEAQVNIRDSLNRLDSENYKDLVNMYDAIDLTRDERKALSLLIHKNAEADIYKYLNNLYEDRFLKSYNGSDKMSENLEDVIKQCDYCGEYFEPGRIKDTNLGSLCDFCRQHVFNESADDLNKLKAELIALRDAKLDSYKSLESQNDPDNRLDIAELDKDIDELEIDLKLADTDIDNFKIKAKKWLGK